VNSTISVAIAAISVFVLSSVWYTALTPLEARALGPAAINRGRPSPLKALLELLRSILVGAVIAGVARAAHVHTVCGAVLLGLVLWTGFPLVLLTGSMMWDKVPTPTALLHAGDWLLKLVAISAIVGLWL
jgi:ABC-type glucose/galactose transport system permease subunit